MRVGSEQQPQVREFEYLGNLFASDGKMGSEVDRQIGAVSAVMQALYQTMMKREPSKKAKLYQPTFVSTLT